MRSAKPRIAIATCAAYEELKADDRLLQEALRERGAEAVSVVWDEAEPAWEDFDLCLVRSTWDYHEKHEQFLAWTQRVAAATQLHNPAELIAWNSNKTYLQELGSRGVPVVPTYWVDQRSQIDAAATLDALSWHEAVIKPAVDLGARNLRRVKVGADDVQAALEEVLARGKAMLQPFFPRLETEGELSLIYIDGAFSHAVRKRPAPGDFRVQSIWGGTVEPLVPTDEDLEVGQFTMSRLKEPPLYARVDLVTGGPYGMVHVIELELIEPNLYLSTNPGAAARLAEAALLRIDVDADRDILQ
jgi:glutathione synthase/RimK-type ligase-like ATP-grasp enzyme